MIISNSGTALYRSAVQPVRLQTTIVATKAGDAPRPAPSRDLDGEKATTPVSFRDSARQKLDADYAKAIAAGTRAVVDTAYGGRHLDVSGLTDRELAAVAKGQGFTKGESETAKGALADRMWAALAPFPADTGDQARAIKAMYPAVPQDVKDALGWNQAMLESGDRIIGWYDNQGGGQSNAPSKTKSLFDMMLEGQNDPTALRLDMGLVQAKGGSINATA